MAAIAEVPISLAGDNAKIAEFAKQLTADGEHGALGEAQVAATAGGWQQGQGWLRPCGHLAAPGERQHTCCTRRVLCQVHSAGNMGLHSGIAATQGGMWRDGTRQLAGRWSGCPHPMNAVAARAAACAAKATRGCCRTFLIACCLAAAILPCQVAAAVSPALPFAHLPCPLRMSWYASVP
jgi:hypothetical protein